MAFIYVRFVFVNKKGEKKSVRFPMDERSYEAYHDPSVPKEWTNRMMLQEYREYCAERKYRSKCVQIPVRKDGTEMEIPDPSPSIVEIIIQREEEEMRRSAMSLILRERAREGYATNTTTRRGRESRGHTPSQGSSNAVSAARISPEGRKRARKTGRRSASGSAYPPRRKKNRCAHTALPSTRLSCRRRSVKPSTGSSGKTATAT